MSIYPLSQCTITDSTFHHHSDVSANSARISLAVDGAVGLGYGTSYSSPIWASVIALVRLCTYVLAIDASTDSASAATD